MAEVRKNDPTRKCSANMVEFGKGTLSQVIDVQGFSHGGGHQAVQYRKAGFEKVRCFAYFPVALTQLMTRSAQPVVNSECCSCRTIRGFGAGDGVDRSDSKYFSDYTAFNAKCMAQQTNISLSNHFVAGSFIWTL